MNLEQNVPTLALLGKTRGRGCVKRVQDVIKPNLCIIRAVGKPPGYFLHLVRNMQPTMCTNPTSRQICDQEHINFPLPKRGSAARENSESTEQDLYTPQKVANNFGENKAHPLPPCGGHKLLRTLSHPAVPGKGQSCKFTNNVS